MKDAMSCSLLMHRHDLDENCPGSLGRLPTLLCSLEVVSKAARSSRAFLGMFPGLFLQASLCSRSGKCILWDQLSHGALSGHRGLQNFVICAVTRNTGAVTT